MIKEPKKHPSGRAIHRNTQGTLSIWRIPSSGPVLPSLQKRDRCPAIGFTVGHLANDDENE